VVGAEEEGDEEEGEEAGIEEEEDEPMMSLRRLRSSRTPRLRRRMRQPQSILQVCNMVQSRNTNTEERKNEEKEREQKSARKKVRGPISFCFSLSFSFSLSSPISLSSPPPHPPSLFLSKISISATHRVFIPFSIVPFGAHHTSSSTAIAGATQASSRRVPTAPARRDPRCIGWHLYFPDEGGARG
jgi:hypothetical protein